MSFQAEGEICRGCVERWTKKGMSPKILVALPNRTAKQELVIVVCPWCDGEPIVKNPPQRHRGS